MCLTVWIQFSAIPDTYMVREMYRLSLVQSGTTVGFYTEVYVFVSVLGNIYKNFVLNKGRMDKIMDRKKKQDLSNICNYNCFIYIYLSIIYNYNCIDKIMDSKKKDRSNIYNSNCFIYCCLGMCCMVFATRWRPKRSQVGLNVGGSAVCSQGYLVWFPSSLEATRCHGNAFRMESSMFMSDVAPGVSTSIPCALRASVGSRALSYVRVPLLQWV